MLLFDYIKINPKGGSNQAEVSELKYYKTISTLLLKYYISTTIILHKYYYNAT